MQEIVPRMLRSAPFLTTRSIVRRRDALLIRGRREGSSCYDPGSAEWHGGDASAAPENAAPRPGYANLPVAENS